MLADCHRLWIDAGQLVRAEFAKERNSILGHDNSVRNSILGWCRFYLDVASARIKPADHARFLEREPQDSFLIENRCMRIFSAPIEASSVAVTSSVSETVRLRRPIVFSSLEIDRGM